jgi:truncated hemoglobin YjbI
MINRLLNTKLPSEQRDSWLSELRAALKHPLASEQTRKAAESYLTYQKGNAHES